MHLSVTIFFIHSYFSCQSVSDIEDMGTLLATVATDLTEMYSTRDLRSFIASDALTVTD